MTNSTARCDVLVIGGGIAALVAALEARQFVDDVVLVSKRKPGRSGNVVVSGAAFSAYVPSDETDDSPERHLQDTLDGGDGINDPVLARVLVDRAGASVLALERYGVKLLRAGGELVRRTPPGHSRPRSIPSDPTGYVHATRGLSVTLPLLESAGERGIRLLSGLPVHRLLVSDGVVSGAAALDLATGSEVTLRARSVILAAGGGGCLFSNTNNTSEMTADSYAMALDAGLALRDMEFVQFYPTMMSSPAHVPISSPLFGEGAVLRNRHGERFMTRYDPTNADMATRDAMSRAIFSELQAGNGVEGGVYMDCSAVPEAVLRAKFPTVLHLMLSHGIDLSSQWVVVSPATHFLMGGAWIDERCHTGVDGLFIAGEAAGGVHGANRLSGNALSEAAVFGSIAGREAAQHALRTRAYPDVVADSGSPAQDLKTLALAEVKAQLRRTMWEQASIVRSEQGLRRGLASLQECLDALPHCRVETPAGQARRAEIEGMARVGLCVVTSALSRRESRGAHFREDYPARDDSSWRGSSAVRWEGGEARAEFVPLPAV